MDPKKLKDLNAIISNKYKEILQDITELPPHLRKDLKLPHSSNKTMLQVVENDLQTVYNKITNMRFCHHVKAFEFIILYRKQLTPLTYKEALIAHDLSGGKAPIPIPCYNEIDDAGPPKNFEVLLINTYFT